MVTLYSAWYCPFAQRAWIGLSHKKLSFDYVEIDPYDKSADWMRLSRGTGQVPVLQRQAVGLDAAVVVPDSLRVLEYIDAAFRGQGPDLFPRPPAARAEALYWTDFPARKIIPYMYRALKAPLGSEAGAVALRAMADGLATFSAAMSPQGPFFSGAEPNAVDIAFAPFASRIAIILSHYRSYTVPLSGDVWQRYAVWLQAIQQSSLLSATQGDSATYDDRLVAFYLPYSKGGGQADVTVAA
ncbi:MAG: glutathione S-transferase family protein [Rhodobacteraceae bacterium]|nr:glutathione S-transferase family protein [Paracoccaceae bacterium]